MKNGSPVAGSTLSIGAEHAKSRVEAQLQGRRFDPTGSMFVVLLQIGMAVALLSLAAVLWSVFVDGSAHLAQQGTSFVTDVASSRSSSFGVFEGIRGTMWIGIFVIVVAFPAGIGAAIYLEEYATDGRLTRFIRLNIRNLAGVPSVVYGILGLSIFVRFFGGFFPNDRFSGETTAAAGATMAVLVLPIVVITAAEAIRAVPASLREAGFGIGATKWQVIRDSVLPYAAPGILTGTLLSLARALGEAAPLILIGGVFAGSLGPSSSLFELEQLGEEFTAMPLLITQLAKKPSAVGDWAGATSAAIVVLLVVVVAANILAVALRNRYEKKRG